MKPPPLSVSRHTCMPTNEDTIANTAGWFVAEALPAN